MRRICIGKENISWVERIVEVEEESGCVRCESRSSYAFSGILLVLKLESISLSVIREDVPTSDVKLVYHANNTICCDRATDGRRENTPDVISYIGFQWRSRYDYCACQRSTNQHRLVRHAGHVPLLLLVIQVDERRRVKAVRLSERQGAVAVRRRYGCGGNTTHFVRHDPSLPVSGRMSVGV